jgi:glycosyltransferase involved in cell wall biosynthesis
VLHVIPWVATVRGGPSYALLRLARALAARGVEVEIAATRADLRPGEEERVRDWLGPNVPLGLVDTFGPRPLEFAPGWIAHLVPRIRRADLVHVHMVFTYPVAVAPRLCRLFGVPYLIRPAGTLDRGSIASRSTRKKRLALALVCRRNLLQAAAVHVTSAMEERELRALVPSAHLARVELGVDGASQPLARAPGDGTRVGFLGRLHPKKGLELLLDALARLPPALRLEIAGDGEPSYVAQLRDRARALGVGERVRWLGHLDEPEKERFLAGADVVAFPSRGENFGVAVAEAMAAGCAVVVSPEVALSEDIRAHGAGEVVSADPAALAAALAGLAADGGLRARLGAAARALAVERWSWDRISAQTLALYEDSLARRRS